MYFSFINAHCKYLSSALFAHCLNDIGLWLKIGDFVGLTKSHIWHKSTNFCSALGNITVSPFFLIWNPLPRQLKCDSEKKLRQAKGFKPRGEILHSKVRTRALVVLKLVVVGRNIVTIQLGAESVCGHKSTRASEREKGGLGRKEKPPSQKPKSGGYGRAVNFASQWIDNAETIKVDGPTIDGTDRKRL